MNEPGEHLELACERLAEYLESHKNALIGEWVASVRSDSGVPSDAMTKPEIIDHLPNIFDAIVQAVRDECRSTTADRLQNLAARHTIVRWVQHYDLTAVLREISLLRAGLIRYLCAFEDDPRGFGNDARLFASTTIHRILDDIAMDATGTFLKLNTQAAGDEPGDATGPH